MSGQKMFLCVIFACIVSWGVNGQEHTQRDVSQNFDFKSYPGVLSIGQRIIAGYNPDDPVELVELLKEKRVQAAIELDESQQKAVNELFTKKNALMREESMALSTPERSLQFKIARTDLAERYLDEVLTGDQYNRLKNFAYRSEVDAIGWADSISGGRLSDAVGVYDGQRTALHQRTSAIVAEHEARILEIKKQMEAAILKELSAEQRGKAVAALGEFYDYKPVSIGDQIREATIRLNELRKNEQPKK